MVNGMLHREDGPALEWCDGQMDWYVNGARHREDGPAIVYANGSKRWYLNGKQLSEEEFLKKTQKSTPASCEGKIVEIEGKKYRLIEVNC